MNTRQRLLGGLLLALSSTAMADHRHPRHHAAHGDYPAYEYRHQQRERAYWRGYHQGYRDARREHRSYHSRRHYGQADLHYRRHVHSHYCDHRPKFNSRVKVFLNL